LAAGPKKLGGESVLTENEDCSEQESRAAASRNEKSWDLTGAGWKDEQAAGPAAWTRELENQISKRELRPRAPQRHSGANRWQDLAQDKPGPEQDGQVKTEAGEG
jgi:hypothetical protein